MTRPSVVVFDLGKVLLDFDYSIASRRLAAKSTRPWQEIQHLIDHTPLLYRYETGLMTRQQFYDEVRAATGYQGTMNEFSSYFSDIFKEIPDMVQLHSDLRGHGLPTFIFSNTNDLAVEHIRTNFPFFVRNEGLILSYEHGAMKPDARLYEVVERMAGRSGADVVYLDDRPENVEAGAARGWQVVLQETPAKSRAALARLGLLD